MDAGWKRPRDAWGVYLWWPDVGNGIIAPLQARLSAATLPWLAQNLPLAMLQRL